MKQEIGSLKSSAGLFVSLLCFIGVLHVEYKLYTHEAIFVKDSSCHKTQDNTVEAERLKSFEMELKRTTRIQHENRLVRVRRDERIARNTSSIDFPSIRQHIKEELFSILKKEGCVSDRTMCLRGPRGIRGRRGRSGPPGQSGKQGKTGKRGQIGKHGPAGPRGLMGVPGPPGPKGDQGPIGLSGPRGLPGRQGHPAPTISAPSINVPQKTITVNISDTTWLPCVAKGNPAPKITWSKINGGTLPVGRHDVHPSGLSIKYVTSEDEGHYSCMAKSALGDAQANVTLFVQVPPRLVQVSSSKIVEEGANITLSCSASGRPSPSITWSKAFGSITEKRTTEQAGKLTISKITMADSGYYVCEAVNLLGKKSTRVQITVFEALRFKLKPANESRHRFGERVILHCKASGAIEALWKKDNKPLPASNVMFTNGTLVIPRFTLKDLGVYVCHVRNPRHTMTAQTILNLQDPFRSCSEMKANFSMISSGNYLINPGGSSPFKVYCDMSDKGGVGVTVISHDSEARTLVNGLENPGSYRKDIHYTGATMTQLAALTKVSQSCEQFVKYECRGDVAFIAESYGWWMSRDNVKQNYWGGAKPGSGKCACGMSNSCQRQSGGCNCNNVGSHREWHSDSGLLTDKSTLPMTQLRLGDTGQDNEMAYYTLGKLKCYGTL